MDGGGGRGRGGWRYGGRSWRGGGRGRGGRSGWAGRGAAVEPPSSAGTPLSVAFEAEPAFMACLSDRACPFELRAAESGTDGATRATLYVPSWSEAQLVELIDWFDVGCNSLGVASLHFPAAWPKEDRARAHADAEARGLVSRSKGVGPLRSLWVLSPAAADREDEAGSSSRTAAQAVDDETLFALLRAAREAGTQLSRGEAADMVATQAVPPAIQAVMDARAAALARTEALAAACAAADVAAVNAILDEVASSAPDADAAAAAVRRACAAQCDSGCGGGVRRGDTAMHAAARNGALPVIATLLARGADVDACDGRGLPALEAARAAEQCETEAALLRAGAADTGADVARFAAPQPQLGGGRGGGRGWGRGRGRSNNNNNNFGSAAQRREPPQPKDAATAHVRWHARCWRGTHVAAAAAAGFVAGAVLVAAVLRRRR